LTARSHRQVKRTPELGQFVLAPDELGEPAPRC
jgi:hypothetical protein